MKATFILFSFFIAINFTYAQFQDNFDNGTFPNDPQWFGDTGIYGVNATEELQLMDTIENESFVYAVVNTADSTGWELFFRLDFDPSTSNLLKVYLASDSPDLEGALNGYFLQIGASGGNDAIELRRQDGTTSSLIFSGTTAAVAISPVVKVRVTRNNDGLWQLFADYSGGDNLVFDGSGMDDTYTTGSYFGFRCKYSASRSDKFFFDNILIGPTIQDQTPPMLLSVLPQDANTLEVIFDEPLDEEAAENTGNYSIDNGININDAIIGANSAKVILSVSNLTSGQTYHLTSSGIEDLSGNVSALSSTSFIFFETEAPAPFDILINEVFPTPNPAITDLPDAEYFELYNQSSKAIDLEGFTISDASNSKTLQTYILAPQSYLIICNSDAVGTYSAFGPVLGISGLFGLNNTGDDLSIADATGNILHSISYNNAWYQDEDKADGGWSIEMVNPALYCQGESNWRASVNVLGGTPGQQNSVFDDSPDLIAPSLVDAIPISQNKLRLFFSEIMNENAENISAYDIPGAGNTIDATLERPEMNTVLLTIEAPFFTDQQSYTISVSDGVSDCVGNPVGASNSFEFTYYLTQPADRYDILINEIFPQPSPSIGLPGKEFVELYNRSEKAINLEDFILSDGSTELFLPYFILLPDAYVIVYGGAGSGYGAFGDTLLLDLNIGLTDDGDLIELLSPEGETIYAIEYDRGWYKDSTKDQGGWTLELIDPENPCAFASNWRASVNANGGTPGQPNSVLDPVSESENLDLVKAFPLSSTRISLTFSKAFDETKASDPTNYAIEGFTILTAIPVPPFYDEVTLELDSPIADSQIYEVMVKSSLTDCIGNPMGLFNRVRFAIPQEIEERDLVINEILVKPQTGGKRFLELYNRSAKAVNIGDLIIGERNAVDNTIENPYPVSIDCLVFPGDYIILTPSSSDIKERYFTEYPNAFINTGLPSYDEKEGTIVVYTAQVPDVKIIDEFEYSQDLHNALLDDKDGVSLERIDPERSTSEPANWHSAAERVGFATPTYQNSQFIGTTSAADEFFTLPSKRLSPDGDGFEDFLLINYSSDRPGYLVNLNIYDAKGRGIKTLANNELLASEGVFKWDGDTDEGHKARIGIYIVWIELFNPDGEVRHFKKTCVLAGVLD